MEYKPYTGPWLKTWLEKGNKNPWIGKASDPDFNEGSFCVVDNVEELHAQFIHSNWGVGQAFVLGDIAFINQHLGGSEWLVIRRDVSFESLSGGCYTLEKLQWFVDDVNAATDEQLRELKYVRPHPTNVYKAQDGVIYKDDQPLFSIQREELPGSCGRFPLKPAQADAMLYFLVKLLNEAGELAFERFYGEYMLK